MRVESAFQYNRSNGNGDDDAATDHVRVQALEPLDPLADRPLEEGRAFHVLERNLQGSFHHRLP